MARIIMTLELDDGSAMEFVGNSPAPITDLGEGLMLAQLTYLKLARACGMRFDNPEPEPPAEQKEQS